MCERIDAMTAMVSLNTLRAVDTAVPVADVCGMKIETRLASYPDGRLVAYSEFGDPHGACTVFYFHSGGSSRLEGMLGDAAAAARNIRLVCLDRPGAGRSTPLRDRTFVDPAQDVAAVAGLLGIRRYVVAGFSAGAPHALAAVLAAPQQTVGAILVNTTGDRFHPAWRRQPLFARAIFAVMVRKTVSTFIWRQTLRQVERRAARGDALAAALAAFLREGGRQGGTAVDDEMDLCYRRSWGLDWSALARPVLAVQGQRDPNLPFACALQDLVAWLRVRTIPGGHMDGASAQAWERIVEAALHFDAPAIHARTLGSAPFAEAFPK
jgi:pimeloyl-ACP methyl ester carboxylesterase